MNNTHLIDFPLREKKLDNILKNGLLYEFKYLKINNKKNNIGTIYKSNGKMVYRR